MVAWAFVIEILLNLNLSGIETGNSLNIRFTCLFTFKMHKIAIRTKLNNSNHNHLIICVHFIIVKHTKISCILFVGRRPGQNHNKYVDLLVKAPSANFQGSINMMFYAE